MKTLNVLTDIARRQWSITCQRERLTTRVVPSKKQYNRRDTKKAAQQYDS